MDRLLLQIDRPCIKSGQTSITGIKSGQTSIASNQTSSASNASEMTNSMIVTTL